MHVDLRPLETAVIARRVSEWLGSPQVTRRSVPESRVEARAVSSLFEAPQVLSGPDSGSSFDKFCVEERLGEFDVLHFALPLWLRPSCPARSAVVLPRRAEAIFESQQQVVSYQLYDVEAMTNWQLAATLVVFSGCLAEPAVEVDQCVDLLQDAVLGAGARWVLINRWAVPEKPKSLLLWRFYRNIRQREMRPDDALSDAQRWLRSLSRRDVDRLWDSGLAADKAAGRLALRDVSPTAVRPYAAPEFWEAWELTGR